MSEFRYQHIYKNTKTDHRKLKIAQNNSHLVSKLLKTSQQKL